MEEWEAIVDKYEEPVEPRSFLKACQSVKTLLEQDLAPFEIDWLLDTLFLKPVNLITTVATKCSDDAWSQSIGDAFKLLSELIMKHPDHASPHFENIVKLCNLSYDARTRQHALHCLTCVVRHSEIGAANHLRYIHALEEDSTCKATMAELVGAICEYHPDMVSEDVTTIWRVYLNLLDSNKFSDTVVRSVLLGILGLFKLFSMDLPTAELNEFYDKLDSCKEKYRCREVYLTILEHYAGLFRERLSADASARKLLWTWLAALASPQTRPALISVYREIGDTVDETTIRRIVTSEVLPHLQDARAHVRLTAASVLRACIPYSEHWQEDTHALADVPALQHSLAAGPLNNDDVETIKWWIETYTSQDDKILKTAIMFHEHIPVKHRKQVVAYGILKAPHDVRTEVVTFLINETCQSYKDNGNFNKYMPLWRSLFDTVKGTDTVVTKSCCLVLDAIMDYLVYNLESFLEIAGSDSEELPDKLRCLLVVSSQIIPLLEMVDGDRERCLHALQLLHDLRLVCSSAVSAIHGAIRAIALYLDDYEVISDDSLLVRIDNCRDNVDLYESCLALILTPVKSVRDIPSLLTALQITFARRDVEPAMLSRSIRTLESLILTQKEKLDDMELNDVINHVERMYHRIDLKAKEGRSLRRDVLMFLGKYGTGSDVNNNSDDEVTVHLKSSLTLGIPDPSEGITDKVNLERILRLALKCEDAKALRVLIEILCANASRRTMTQHEQRALCRALYALAHAHTHADDTCTLEALSKCGETAVPILLQLVCRERKPSVRRAALGWLFHSHSQATLLAIAQQAATCMDPASTTKSIGLDIAQMLISALKDENTLVKTVLPELIIQISNTRELYAETAFNNATELLIDKIELFENEVLKSITINLLKVLCSSQNGGTSHGMADIRIMRKFTKMTIEFLKRLGEYKGNNLFDVVDDIFMIVGKKVVEFSRLFYVLSVVKEVYQLDTDRCRNILLREGNYISNILLDERENQVSLDYLHLEAVLKFCTVYAEVLLELHYEGTLNFLSRILTKLHPYQVELQYASILTCLTKCREILKSTPRILITSFENWCRKLPVEDIRGNLQRYKFSKEDMALVKSLKHLLECFDITDPGFADLNRHTQNWLHCVQELNESGYIERNVSKLPYLTDLLHVLFRFLTVTDVKSVISICGEEFCAIFMPALFRYFVRQPYLLLDHNLEKFCGLLNEIVRYYVRKCNLEEYCDLILNLVDTLWPKYESVCDFKKKHSLLVDMLSLPRKLGPYSNPMQWIVDSIRSDECSCEMKAKLIGVLPTGEAYSGTWQCFLGLVPARLGDARGEQSLMLRALLDALLVADCSLLDHLCQLVSGDTEKGWWDDAIDACMVTLASRNDITIYETVYKKCSDGLSLGVCNRLMVPLLRCSNASLCEEFFSGILKDLLAVLRKRPRGATAHYIYHKAVVDYLRALILLKVAFEKIPRAHIESPNSVLYKRMSAEVQDNIFYLAKTVAMCCVELEAKKVVVCPAGADQKLKNNCLLFHCENYNCLTAAIFCREPKESKFYDLIYNEAAWNRIVDPDVTYDLPLRAQWRKRTVKQAVSVELSRDSPLLGRSLTRTSTRTRTRTFLHTLSENPLDFDLQLPCDEQDDGHEMSVSESSVNEHACAATLTAATSRICLLPISSWQHRIAAALRAHLHHNVKWLLAQVICNCTEDVKSHASILRPALLEMIVQTSSDGAGGVLNGLHVQILDTIIQWRGETNELESDAIDNLNVTIERLIATCIRNARRQEIVNDLIEKMNSLLEMYGTVVKIGWTCFQDYMEARNTSAPKTYLQILKNITKRKIHIPELLPNLIQTLESRKDRNSRLANLANQVDLGQLAQLFGRALAAAPVSTRFEMLKRYRNVLEKNKNDVSEYIKLLYNAQVEFPEVCDGLHFRRVTDLATKVVGRNKTKCLEILSMYIAKASRDEDITAMFETIEISELMVRGDEIVLGLVMNGLLVMGEQLKRRVILQCVEHCSHPVWKVRKAALGVLLKAFEGLIVPSAEESNPKRPAKLNNPLMRDVGFNKPMAAFGLGLVCEPDTGDLRDAMSRHLTAAGLVKRFCETFIITVHLPVLHAACSEKYMSVCVSALLDIFFKDLRENEAFKRTLLRDQPLESTSSAATVKTVARTASRPASNQDNATTEEIKSVDDALGALLQFAKSSPEVASALCLQVMSALNSRTSSGFDFAATMSELLVPMLGRISDLTPFLVEACRLFVDECCHINGFKETVEALVKTAKGTEGQCLVQALYEDVLIRCPGLNYFILSKINHDNEDWDMTELNKHFSLEDLVTSFGMLSNWEDLTLQQRTSVESSLPPLWVDIDTYKVDLDGWSDTSSNSWFEKMASVYRKESYLSMKWLSELLRWPRSLFSTSATVEAIQLERMQKESFDDFLKYLSCDIRPVDCLAEWAARILTRAAYLEKATEEYRKNYTDSKSLSLSHALQWCLSANERELPSQVLRCVRSFIKEETTTLPWLSQELIALRKLALRSNIEGDLTKILERAETEGALVSQGAQLEDIIEINHLTLLLHRDLNSLTKEKLQYSLNNMQQQYLKASEGAIVQGRNKQMLQSMVELAIMHYDGLWKEVNDSEEQNTILTDICSALDLALSLNLNLKYSNLLDVILNRLGDFAGYKLSDEATSAVLGTMETLIHEMDDFAMDEIKRNISKFSSQRSSELIAKLEGEEVETSKFKKCLQLVADAEYALKQYCRGLRVALERDDGVEWSQIFNRMKEKIFENPYAGPDYQVLSKYHTVLYSISDFDHMDKTSAKQTLQRLTNELSSNKQTLRLSQLCPTLAQATILRGSETDDCLSRLLMLPRGVHFLKFEEQVSVFTESVRRPVVVTVRLSDGNTRPLLVKGGESLRRDAAALRLLRGLPIPAQQHYQVTPLSEDCGLIEYLEGHERLRALISSKYDVDGILASVSRASGDELILKPREDCIKEFERICSKLPSYALRSVIEMRSSCIEDFISKKQQFEEGLSVMTFVTWLLGVGDRHLDNILMSLRHGSVCSVDWNCTLRHGRAELPPARLTRNLLALCRPTVLESRLQKLTAASRDSHRVLLPVLQVSFRWMGKEVENELADVSDLLRGEALPHQVSQRAGLRSVRKYSHKYSQLLERIFADYSQKDKYSVEEQVSNLLRHCTDPQILGVTRSNWEPWI